MSKGGRTGQRHFFPHHFPYWSSILTSLLLVEVADEDILCNSISLLIFTEKTDETIKLSASKKLMGQALAWMESLREWPRAFVPLHRGNLMLKNRAGSEGSLFLPDMDNKAMQTRHIRKLKKRKQSKTRSAKQNRLSSGFFPAVLPADREKNWEESVNIHDWASEAKQWGGSSVPWVASDLKQRAQAAQSGAAVVKLVTHDGGNAGAAVRIAKAECGFFMLVPMRGAHLTPLFLKASLQLRFDCLENRNG